MYMAIAVNKATGNSVNKKDVIKFYDIADDVSNDKGNNYTLRHLKERIKIYKEEDFNYEIIDIKLKNHEH